MSISRSNVSMQISRPPMKKKMAGTVQPNKNKKPKVTKK